MHPPASPAWANFTLMMECTPESSVCYSVVQVLSASTVYFLFGRQDCVMATPLQFWPPACWEYEGARAKILVYYPRNELKNPVRFALYLTTEFDVWRPPAARLSSGRFADFLPRMVLADLLLETFAWFSCNYCRLRILQKYFIVSEYNKLDNVTLLLIVEKCLDTNL